MTIKKTILCNQFDTLNRITCSRYLYTVARFIENNFSLLNIYTNVRYFSSNKINYVINFKSS